MLQPQIQERDWKAEAEGLRGQMTDDRLKALAETNGVVETACAKLSPGWATKDDLLRLRASGTGWQEDPPDGEWGFAEHGGDGRVVGLSLRAPDGRKGSIPTATSAGRGHSRASGTGTETSRALRFDPSASLRGSSLP